MLMITRSEVCDRGTLLKLEGKLVGPWIDEVASACGHGPADARRVRLDLDGVTFVDSEGTALLLRLLQRGTQVIACSSFVAEMLRLLRDGTQLLAPAAASGAPDSASSPTQGE